MHYMLYCMKQMGLFSYMLLERLPLMLMSLLLIRNWCEIPHIQCLFSATKIEIPTSMHFSHSDLRGTSATAELPACSTLSAPFPSSTMFIFFPSL